MAYNFFQNLSCEYFPCHGVNDTNDFNCLMCFCPLYALGRECGGSLGHTEQGVKDCSGCVFPHKRENYEEVLKRLERVIDMAREK